MIVCPTLPIEIFEIIHMIWNSLAAWLCNCKSNRNSLPNETIETHLNFGDNWPMVLPKRLLLLPNDSWKSFCEFACLLQSSLPLSLDQKPHPKKNLAKSSQREKQSSSTEKCASKTGSCNFVSWKRSSSFCCSAMLWSRTKAFFPVSALVAGQLAGRAKRSSWWWGKLGKRLRDSKSKFPYLWI